VVKSEERRLRKHFGVAFEDYTQRVPPFFPKFSTFSEPEQYVVKPGVYRKHMFSALWFVWLVGAIEVIEGLREIGVLTSFWSIY
jgi:hypothetical protein